MYENHYTIMFRQFLLQLYFNVIANLIFCKINGAGGLISVQKAKKRRIKISFSGSKVLFCPFLIKKEPILYIERIGFIPIYHLFV